MSRPVEIRLSWANDAAYLSRLQKAASIDEKHSIVWKRAVDSLFSELIAILLVSPSMADQLAKDVSNRLYGKISKRRATAVASKRDRTRIG